MGLNKSGAMPFFYQKTHAKAILYINYTHWLQKAVNAIETLL